MSRTDNSLANEETWIGDWAKRIYCSVSELGCNSVTSLADSEPTATYQELARRIGKNVAVVQLESLLLREAEQRKTVTHFARASLVRLIHEFCPMGWGVGDKSEFRIARVFSDWTTTLGDAYRDPAQKVWLVLKDLKPHKGWLPVTLEDTLICRAFDGTSFDEG